MKNSICLELLRIDNSFKSWLSTFLMIISLIGLILSFFIFDNLSYTKITLAFSLFFMIYNVFFEREKNIGKLCLNEDEIKVYKTNVEIYAIKDLKSLIVNYNGAKGTFFKSNLNTFFLNDGSNNYIKFIINEQNIKFKFRIDINSVNNFNNVINVWKGKVSNFKFIGEKDEI